jgi:hypothetical protein
MIDSLVLLCSNWLPVVLQETKLGRLAYTQVSRFLHYFTYFSPCDSYMFLISYDRTTRGIYDLCEFTKRLEQSPKADTRQASQQSVPDSLLTDLISLVIPYCTTSFKWKCMKVAIFAQIQGDTMHFS